MRKYVKNLFKAFKASRKNKREISIKAIAEPSKVKQDEDVNQVRAQVLMKKGNYARAFQLLTAELEEAKASHNQDTTFLKYKLAFVLTRLNKFEEALMVYQNLAEDLSNSKRADSALDLITIQLEIFDLLRKLQKCSQALKLIDEICRKCEEKYGAGHPDTLRTITYRGCALRDLKRYDEAIEEFKKVLQHQEKIPEMALSTNLLFATTLVDVEKLEEAHCLIKTLLELPGTTKLDQIAIRLHHAWILQEQKRYNEALPIYEDIFKNQTEILGRHHPDTLTTRHNLASILDDKGSFVEALQHYEAILNIQEKSIGPQHPDTLLTKYNLAFVLDHLGQFPLAFYMLSSTFQSQQAVLGSKHSDTLASRRKMALVLEKMGKYDEALSVIQEVLQTQEQLEDIDGRDLLTTQHNLVFILSSCGKYNEAFTLSESVIEAKTRIYGPEKPEIWSALNNHGFILVNLGRYDEAIKLNSRVSTHQQNLLETSDPDLLENLRLQAVILLKLTKFKEALKIFTKLLQVRKGLLGEANPITLGAKQEYQQVLALTGEHDRALENCFQLLQDQKETLGEKHPQVAGTLQIMGEILLKQGKLKEASNLFLLVLKIRREVFGESHPQTLLTQEGIAAVMETEGKFEDALELNRTILEIRTKNLGANHSDTLKSRLDVKQAAGIIFGENEAKNAGSHSSSVDSSTKNSYTSIAGFPVEDQTQTNPRNDVNPKVLERIEIQASIRSVLDEMARTNNQLFIRPCSLSTQDQIKVFGKKVSKASEVFCEQGARILIIARTYLWVNYWNWVEPPVGAELERFDFINEDGIHVLRCSIYDNRMKMYVGADSNFGEFIVEDHVSTNCEEIDLGTMIVEDSNSEQVFRFEKDKKHFNVLLYPEQMKMCSIYNYWDPNEFPFLNSMGNHIFGVPLPDDISPRRRALLFAASFYVYHKYYQKDKRCRFILAVFIGLSTVIIVIFIVLQKIDSLEDLK
ncbi:unnamed protein product [Allacma fusca]|uniref:Kinesin light chain n=1 Tax=Allacma fusca TaxID=39272 RepID=A0A8J2JT27_9HEXA|nr:unnamed protein product [Allacma fusca]